MRGVHHPRQHYAEMCRSDRTLRLRGYEVYRFGGAELPSKAAASRLLEDFLPQLLGE